MITRASSFSAGVEEVVFGEPRQGVGMGRGYVAVGDRVLALTPAGVVRMPNGIACELTVGARQPVIVGGGRVEAGGDVVVVDREDRWDAVPKPRFRLAARPALKPDPDLLAGQGPGLTPAGDDLLAGYAAGLVLWHGRRAEAEAIAASAAPRTTLLAATLLMHAARGELPEPAHALLERGDPEPLRRFGRSSGRVLMLGLALAC